MADTKTYEVIHGCSYGKKGALVEIEGELTARQSQMLRPFTKPVVKSDGAEVEALKAENEALKAELEALKADGQQELEVATPKSATKPTSK